MIKVNHGNIEISGSSAEIIDDLADAIKGIKLVLQNAGTPKPVVELIIADAVRWSDMTKEERVKDAFKILADHLDKKPKTPKTETENGGNTDDKKPE